MRGKTCVITGANSGLGLASTRALAAAGARVVMACRSLERAEAAAAEIRAEIPGAELEIVRLDLSDLSQVRGAAAELLERCPRIDVLMNNAGLTVPERRETKDGFELHVGVNHLGPFLLTRLLLPRLRASAPARIVIVASEIHRWFALDLDDLHATSGFSTGRQYGRSKLCNVLFNRALARRLEDSGVTVNACHPGGVATNIGEARTALQRWTRSAIMLFLASPERGARAQVRLACDPEIAGETGGYWIGSKQKAPGKQGLDDELAEALWARSSEWVGLEP